LKKSIREKLIDEMIRIGENPIVTANLMKFGVKALPVIAFLVLSIFGVDFRSPMSIFGGE